MTINFAGIAKRTYILQTTKKLLTMKEILNYYEKITYVYTKHIYTYIITNYYIHIL